MSTTLIVVASATPSALLGALVVLMPALRMRSRAAIELVAADVAVTKAEELLTEYDRNRNKPWYWPTGPVPAIEAAPEPEPAADPHVTGELLAIDGVDTETDAPHEDTDRAGMWRVLLGLGSDLVDRVHDWLPGLLAQWRERNDVGTGETAVAVDRFERFRIDDSPRGRTDGIGEVLAASGYELDDAPVAVDPDWPNDYDPVTGSRVEVVYPEPVRIVRNSRYRDPGMTGQFPYVKVAGAPRHAAPEPEMPAINAAIPAQRPGEVEV